MQAEEPAVTVYIGRWRPSSVSPGAAAFARDVIAKAALQGRERAKNLLWAAGKLADFGIGLGLEPVPGVLLHPSVTERFTRCAPGLSGVARRTLRTNLRFIGRRVVPQLVHPAIRRCPGNGPRSRTVPRRSAAISRWPMPSPPRNGGCGRRGWLAGRGGRADPRRPARRARQRRRLPVRRGGGRGAWQQAAHGAGAGPLPCPAAGRRGVRRGRADLRRRRPGAPEPDEPADQSAGRWQRPAPAGYRPPARDVAGRLRAAAGAGHVHARRRDQLLPAPG